MHYHCAIKAKSKNYSLISQRYSEVNEKELNLFPQESGGLRGLLTGVLGVYISLRQDKYAFSVNISYDFGTLFTPQ